MIRHLSRLLIILLLIVLAAQVSAQSAPLVAFVNPSGQLIAASADGQTRWIVTNPGEMLHPVLGFAWGPDGRSLFYAVGTDEAASLRIGDASAQSSLEIVSGPGPFSGGIWRGNALWFAQNGSLLRVTLDGSSSVIASAGSLTLPDQPGPGDALVFVSDGIYNLLANGSISALPGLAVEGAQIRWSDSAPIAAYSAAGPAGTALYAVHAASGQIAALESDRSTPVLPVTWLPDSTQLVYRDESGLLRLTDLACLSSGCPSDPFGAGIPMFLPSASDIHFSGNWAIFRDNEAVRAIDLTCVSTGSCLETPVTIGTQAAPRQPLRLANNQLLYTAYRQDPVNVADREIRMIDLTCLPNCESRPLLPDAVAGPVSPDGAYLVADLAGTGLQILRLADLNAVNLSGPAYTLGDGLNNVSWSP